MNNFEKLVNTLTEYSKINLTLRELETDFNELYLDSDYDFTDEQVDFLENINTDIGYTGKEPYTKEDKAVGLFTEDQLREKIKNYLRDLAIAA